MSESKEVKGIIEEFDAPEKEGGKTSLKINGLWFGAFKKLEVKKEDYVEGTYTEKENPNNLAYPYKNILTLEKKEKPKDYEEKQDERQTKIIRQACLKAAASAHFIRDIDDSEAKDFTEQIIEMSKKFEAYINEG